MLRSSRWCRAGLVPRFPWASILLVGLSACGGPEPDASPSAIQPAPEPAPPAPGPYELHEWGFVAATMGADDARAISAPGSVPRELSGFGRIEGGTGRGHVHGVGKPVLYFHLDEGSDALELSVGVSAAGTARIVEHFPPGELAEGGQSLRWPSVRVTRGACRGTYPARADVACQLPDGVCEAAEVPGYESAAADCVRVGERAGGVLLYRTGPATSPLPLVVEHADQHAVRVSYADASGSPAPRPSGWVMRIARGSDRASTRVRVVPLGAESVLVPPPLGEGSLTADEGLARLREALAAGGLDEPEQDAFLGAWSDALFGAVPPEPSLGAQGRGADSLGQGGTPTGGGAGVSAGYAPPSRRLRQRRLGELHGGLGEGGSNAPAHPLGSVEDALIYFLPEASVDALLPLTLAPAPRVQRRVFLARVKLTRPFLRVRYAPIEVSGGLDAQLVRRHLRRHVRELEACLPYDAAEGRVMARVRVLTTGAVAQADLEGLDVGAEPRACLLEVLRGIQFPVAEANTQIAQPLLISR